MTLTDLCEEPQAIAALGMFILLFLLLLLELISQISWIWLKFLVTFEYDLNFGSLLNMAQILGHF